MLVSLSRRAFRHLLLLIASLWSLLLLAWLILHWGILPHIDEWRGSLEKRAAAALGVPVAIGRIEVQSSAWMPALSLHDVVLSDPQGRPSLRLPLVAAAVSPQTLLTWSLRFSQLYIEGAQLEVQRDAQGQLHVGGMDMGGAALGQDRQLSDWFFRQQEFAIRHSRLRWVDETRPSAPLALEDVDLVVRNSLRRHDLRLDATPPAGWGERFTLQGRFTQPLLAAPGDWARWSGTAHAALPYADVAQLHQYVELPFDLRTGQGGLRLWLDLAKGQWQGATLDLALDAVQLRLATRLEPLALAQVSGRLQAERRAGRVSVSAQGLSFTTDDGVAWPASQFALSWQQTAADQKTGDAAALVNGQFSADRLDLAQITRIAERLPLPPTLRQALAETAPQGQITGLQAGWSGSADAPEHYQLKAKLTGLGVSTADPSDRPGFQHLDLDLHANETGGEAQLAMRDGTLLLPGVLEDPTLALAHARARLLWHITPQANATPALEVQIKDARLATADLQGEFQARWRTGEGTGTGHGGRFPGVLELDGRLTHLAAPRLVRYLPLAIGPDARSYLSHALQGGKITQLQLKLRGDLWDFPYADPTTGDFKATAQVEGVDLAYAPMIDGAATGWPAFHHVSAEVVMDRTRLQIRNAQGRLWGLELKGVNGQIGNLLHGSVLAIDGTVRGPLADGLRFMAESPVAELTQHALTQATGSGPFELQLGLNIPLLHAEQTTVKGQVNLLGNELRLRPDVPTFSQARARVDFTQRGFSVSGGNARLLGGDASFEGAMQPDGSVRFTGQGVASAEGLSAATELGPLARLGKELNGQASYRLQLGIVHGQTEMLVTSPLIGLGSHLPEPLAKAPETAWPLRYQTTLTRDGTPEAGPRDTLRLELGSALRAEFQRDLSGPQARVLRGAVAWDDTLPNPAAGQVQAALKLGHLNLDAWKALQSRLAAGSPESEGASYAPSALHLQADTVTLQGRHLTHLQTQLQRRSGPEGEAWNVQLQSDQAQGQIDYRAATAAPGSGKLYARLSRLAVPQSDADAVDSLIDQASQRVPALDIVVDDFELRGKKLGKLEVEAAYLGADPAARARPAEGRDWRLSKLKLTMPQAQLSGTGRWAPGLRRHMALDFQLDVNDGGGLLERLGLGRVVKGTSGHIQGSLAWNGSPLSPEWSQMTGQMQLALDKGQFLHAEPGVARLLGVLSLQSLPRRFLLDFRDVFQEGFAFDNVSGDVRLADGIARTSNLRIRGVQAVVLMEGQADLRQETQDLRVFIVPEINAGTASLAYAAINPVIGLSTFLAQVVLRNPLREAGTRELHIGGTWAEPTVDDVARRGEVPLPAVDAPSAAASAVPATAASQPGP